MTVVFDAGDYSLGQTTISGIGLRVAELAAALARHFTVRIYSPTTANQEPVDVGDATLLTDAEHWSDLLAEAGAVVFFDMPNRDRLSQAVRWAKLIVSENAPPIEQLDYPRYRRGGKFDHNAYRSLVEDYRFQLLASHLFIARSDVERLTLVANLCLSGALSADDMTRSRTFEHRITTIPIGYSAAAAFHAAATPYDPHQANELVWTGGLWSYMTPLQAVFAVARARELGHELRLRFLHAAPHRDTTGAVADLTDAARRLAIDDLVTLHTKPLRHSDRDRFLRSAAGFVCLAQPGIENQTCVRLRVRDSRLHRVPMLIDPHGATAIELGNEGLGIPVDPADIDAVASRMIGLVTDAPNTEWTADARSHDWTYEQTIAPLADRLAEQSI